MAVLDTSGVYSAGDDYRVVKALLLPFSTFTQDCVAGCMNTLETQSTAAATDLVALLNAWDVADAAQTTDNLSQTDGKKVLVKADVLEWQVTGSGQTGPQAEKSKIVSEIWQLMSSCPCLAGYMPSSGGGTPLIRS